MIRIYKKWFRRFSGDRQILVSILPNACILSDRVPGIVHLQDLKFLPSSSRVFEKFSIVDIGFRLKLALRITQRGAGRHYPPTKHLKNIKYEICLSQITVGYFPFVATRSQLLQLLFSA